LDRFGRASAQIDGDRLIFRFLPRLKMAMPWLVNSCFWQETFFPHTDKVEQFARFYFDRGLPTVTM